MLGFSAIKFSINGITLSSGLLSSEISSLYGKDVFSLMLKITYQETQTHCKLE